ncbi:hypothetical protein VII00023_01845 [Vibrio ichthyoenteri ATCC 700023]|uniref:Sel1 domain-containing protein n=1 Tax=Vibrio ichthyoenteri ATCC 700023 TaxID=870968 RepID=F9S4V2_9VIBR|nr:tetratricopeptide repeat protein [Vibrio ichthyoenteri]EGU36382.1 hypothetical protein VII00023_01845 [Vibrio ichthyoenteri ATCC 700023]
MKKHSGTLLTSLSILVSANVMAYDLSMEVFEDDDLAIIQKAETSQDPTVLMDAASLLIDESMMQENVDRGYQYLKTVADSGNQEAIIAMADHYYDEEEYQQSLAWYHKAEAGKDPYVLYSLGVMYFDGEGTVADMVKGNEYYRAAAEAGYSDAMYQLAFSYNDGAGIGQDYSKAAYWFEQSANLGDESAMYNLGVSYLNGEGVTKSCVKAMELFNSAIEQADHTLSLAKMGDINSYDEYKKPCGFKTLDFKKSFAFYHKAAMQGHAYSQYSVGYAYRNGTGTWSDFAKALAWFEVAVEYGYSDAVEDVKEVKAQMSSSKIAEAEQLRDSLLDEIW